MNAITIDNYEAYLLDYSEGNLNADAIAMLRSFALQHPELEINLDEFDLPSLKKEYVPIDFKDGLKKEIIYIEDEELINYLEKNLTQEEQSAFELKLASDKHLNFKYELYKKTILTVDNSQSLDNRELFKKTEEDFILSNKLLSFIENQLSQEERVDLERELETNSELKTELDLYKKTILQAETMFVYPNKEELRKKGRVVALFGYRSVISAAAVLTLLAALFVIYRSASPEVTKVGPLANAITQKSGKNTRTTPANTSSLETAFGQGQEKTSSKLASVNEKHKINRVIRVNLKDSLVPVPNFIENEKPKTLANETFGNKIENKEMLNKQEESNVGLAFKNDSVNTNEAELSKQTYLLAVEEMEEGEGIKRNSLKEGIWKRAVQLAKQVNKFGVKSIDGQENSENKFRLSFNSFSVEKK